MPDILIACAYVWRYKGFPHKTRFHLIQDKIAQEDLQNAREFLSKKDDNEEFLLELGMQEEKGLLKPELLSQNPPL